WLSLNTTPSTASTTLPYTTLFRSSFYNQLKSDPQASAREWIFCSYDPKRGKNRKPGTWIHDHEWKLYQTGEFYHLAKDREEKNRSEEHTSELQSREKLVCRLLLEK